MFNDDVNGNDNDDDDGAYLSYKLTYEPSTLESYNNACAYFVFRLDINCG